MAGLLDDPVSYIFGGNTGVTYEGLKRRQEIAKAIASRARPFPKNIGEGIAHIGAELGDVFASRSLDAAERELQTKEDAQLGAARGTAATYGTPAAPPRVAPAAPGATPPLVAPRADAPLEGGGSTIADNPSTSLMALANIQNSLPGGAVQPNPTLAGRGAPTISQPPSAPTLGGQQPDDPMWPRRMAAISGIESGGEDDPYRAVGPKSKTGDRPYGKYQIMGANIPQWSQAALGRPVSVDQFLADDNLQDTIFKHRFGQYVAKYGEGGAARAWFAGEGGMNNLKGKDRNGTTVGAYGRDYMNRLGGGADQSSGAPEGDVPDGVTVFDDEGNPPTPTTIRPAPAAATGPAANAFSATNPLGQLQLPPEQTMEKPGAEPKPPDPLPHSARQQKWLDIINSRFTSPYAKEYAKQQFDIEEKYRTDLSTRREEAYKDQRERWQKKTDDYDKFQREAGDRRFKQQTDLLAATKTQQELEKMIFEAGEPRVVALAKAALDLKNADLERQKREKELTEPKEHVLPGGVIVQRGLGERGYTVAPGVPEDTKLTETQAKTVKFLQRATINSSIIGNGDALRGLKDTVAGKVPIGGNYLNSDEYRSQVSAARAWAYAVLRDESGATLPETEIDRKIWDYFPRPGDSERQVQEKAARRQYEEQSLYHSLGDKKSLMDKWYEHRKSQKVGVNPETGKPFAENTIQRSPSTGKVRRVIGGHWVSPDEF